MKVIENNKVLHTIKNIHFLDGFISLNVDLKDIKIELSRLSTKFSDAKEYELKDFEISSAGYGIHWRLLDKDLSIDVILRMVA